MLVNARIDVSNGAPSEDRITNGSITPSTRR